MTASNRPPSVASGQPWTPGSAPQGGVACPACGLANEPGARTCRNCGLPVASSEDPVRGVAPGRVDLPKVRRSGVSATVGFVLVIGLLLVGGSLAFTGGGGILSSGGRFFGAEASPSPTPAPDVVTVPGTTGDGTGSEAEEEVLPKGTTTKFDYTCEDGAIKDLSRGKWFLSDVVGSLKEAEDGTDFDQIYWKLSRTTDKKTKNATTVTMQWATPKELQDRFDIGRVQGNRALLVTFTGPIDTSSSQIIETEQFQDEGIDQVKRVQMFETGKKIRTAIGIKEDSCARLRATGWGDKKNPPQNARVMLDIERVYE